jgi:hypothetical protein
LHVLFTRDLVCIQSSFRKQCLRWALGNGRNLVESFLGRAFTALIESHGSPGLKKVRDEHRRCECLGHSCRDAGVDSSGTGPHTPAFVGAAIRCTLDWVEARAAPPPRRNRLSRKKLARPPSRGPPRRINTSSARPECVSPDLSQELLDGGGAKPIEWDTTRLAPFRGIQFRTGAELH